MNCPNCDNDLMVRLEPQGAMRFLRFLPVESYYCVKCGKRVARLAGPSSNPAVGVALMVLVLAGMALAVWRSTGSREAPPPAAPPVVISPAPAPAPASPAPPAPAVPPAAPAAGEAPLASETVPAAQQPAALPQKPAPAAPAKPVPTPAKPAPAPAIASPAALPKAAPAPAPEPAKVQAAPAGQVAAAPAGVRRIAAISAASQGGKAQVSVAAEGPIKEFKTFTLASPPRFVVDLPGRFEYRGPAAAKVQGAALTAVRVGVYPDKVRLVLDFATPGPDGRPAKVPAVAASPQGLVISVD